MESGKRRGSSFLNVHDLGSTAEGSESLRNPYGLSSPTTLSASPREDLNPKRKKRKNRNLSPSDEGTSHTGFLPASKMNTVYHNVSSVTSTASTNSQTATTDSKNFSFNDPLTNHFATNANNSLSSSPKKSRGKNNKTSPQKNTLMNYSFTRTSPVKKNESRSNSPDDVEVIAVIKPNRSLQLSQASCKQNANVCDDKSKIQRLDPYGLLGLGDPNDWEFDSDDNLSQEVKVKDWLSTLPEHVLECIFVLIPITDLLLSVSPVCRRFHEVIQNDKFLLWKKRYNRLKANNKKAESEMNCIFSSEDMNLLENILPNLPGCLKDFRRSQKDDQMLLDCLRLHPRYHWAVVFLKEKTKGCFRTDGVKEIFLKPNPWCVVAALTVLSHSVQDVLRLLRLLSRSLCPILDVMESLYCLAAFLFHASRIHKALYNLHYYVFYALYLFENQWQAKAADLHSACHPTGQQNILKYSEGDVKMTHEQMRIVHHSLLPKQIIKVVAFAGTGKTSTLINFSKLRQGLKFLLVVYNKATKLHASKTFPANVECRTFNSMAYEVYGKRLRRKLTIKLRPLDIQSHLLQKVRLNKTIYARHVLNTLSTFMNSADPFLTLAHISSYREDDEESLTDEDALCALKDAEHIWKKMIDPFDDDVRALHDTYLKLYQLDRPVWENYACILVDEAQDCNPAILDVILSQTCPKILVGDPNQQIYSFRGSVNALDSVQSTHTYYLTQSFRFGPEIAYVAHCTLVVLKNILHKTLVGGSQESHVTGKFEGQLAIIARTNSSLFEEAVRLICKRDQKPHEPNPSEIRGAFIGGLSSYNLQQLVDIHKLLQGENLGDIKDKFISRFKSFQALQTYGKHARDADLFGKTNLVLRHSSKIPEYVKMIGERCAFPLKFANVVFTTAHKSKGLEFDTVYLPDDFSLGIPHPILSIVAINHLLTQPANVTTETANEYNTLYVALTRAKKCLLLPSSLRAVLIAAQENFEVPVLLESESECCVKCKESIISPDNDKNSFVLYKKPLITADGIRHRTGLMCNGCASPRLRIDDYSRITTHEKSRIAFSKILGTVVP